MFAQLLISGQTPNEKLGMTVHYVADGTLHSAMLACSRSHGSHTGFAIAEEFEKVSSSFQVAKKVIVTATDSAANMMKAFSLYRLPSDDGEKEFEDCDSDNEEEVDVNVVYVLLFQMVMIMDS